ncbi:MAG: D-2-hydroxyacid dehydrogenase [Oscillospiraceae bacterium]
MIVVLDSFATISTDLSLDFLKEFGEVVVYERTKKSDIVSRIGSADIVFTNKTPLTKEILSMCPNIKYIGLFSTGYNIVDTDYAKEKGIIVTNVPAYSTNAVAQLVFSFILHFYSMVSWHDQKVHEGQWQNCKDFCFYNPNISELYGKTIGIIGFGSIGKKVYEIAKAFDMKVLVNTRTINKNYNPSLFVSMPELLEKSDIVTIHCPLFDSTKNLLNEQTISLMKKSAILINTSRGGVVDEQALANALNNATISGGAVDVVSYEPIMPDNPLLKAKNCVITPHIAWAGKETRSRLLDVVYLNLKSYLNGEVINNVY